MRATIGARWLTSLAMAGFGAIALAQESKGNDDARQRMFEIVRAECKADKCNLSDADLDAMRANLNRFADRGGHQAEMRSAIRASLEAGCKGACLAEAVRSMSDLMEHGRTDRQCREMVIKALRDEKREHDQKKEKEKLSDAQRGEMLHARLERQHGADHDLAHEQMRDEAREMQRDRMDAGRGEGMPRGR